MGFMSPEECDRFAKMRELDKNFPQLGFGAMTTEVKARDLASLRWALAQLDSAPDTGPERQKAESEVIKAARGLCHG